ncbi:conserved hypothetical protein [Gloeothece citriformis PCC 7424]|uniref:Uncharacterized protein n=1 Tax=Gloeothece citriformis (strain PCC 7424) TaxID=65393 RepID=B7K9F5_GLOC7|nr:hypothetical protein [Gloeothece citriformis]ACK68638.1 conserved hypothetical protein [Gloeothece citriformis PCC 7424]
MKVERPHIESPSFEELKNLDKLKTIIERATADGLLTQEEMETIKCLMRADGKISPEELELCQNLIWDKINRGELTYDWTQMG